MSTGVFAQAHKTVIIDTLLGYTEEMQVGLPLVQSVPEKGKELIIDQTFQPEIAISTKYPNAIVTNIDLNKISLLLDNKGGVISLFSLDNIVSDTIRINKWMIHKNGLTDTVRGTKAYFQMYNDSMSKEPCKIEAIKYLERNKGKKKLKNINVAINGKHYNIPVEIITVHSSLNSSFHGYTPRKTYNAFMSKSENDKKVYRYKRFMGETKILIRRFNASLQL